MVTAPLGCPSLDLKNLESDSEKVALHALFSGHWLVGPLLPCARPGDETAPVAEKVAAAQRGPLEIQVSTLDVATHRLAGSIIQCQSVGKPPADSPGQGPVKRIPHGDDISSGIRGEPPLIAAVQLELTKRAAEGSPSREQAPGRVAILYSSGMEEIAHVLVHQGRPDKKLRSP